MGYQAGYGGLRRAASPYRHHVTRYASARTCGAAVVGDSAAEAVNSAWTAARTW